MTRFIFATLMLTALAITPVLAAPSYTDKKQGRVAYAKDIAPAEQQAAGQPVVNPADIEPAAGVEADNGQRTNKPSLSAERNRLPRKN